MSTVSIRSNCEISSTDGLCTGSNSQRTAEISYTEVQVRWP
jgi:hypothetical protein